jgi:DMSO/TMAO reductase YedYZ molybdopterin-dependent catalytic subunit
VGAGLGKRRALDLATLDPGSLVPPSDRFFIRTGCPVGLPAEVSWTVRVHGLVEEPAALPLESLRRQATDQGLHLLECAGNSKAAHFGFLGVARFKGTPLAPLLERARPRPRATQVLVSGFDEHAVQDPGSMAGASWIFGLERLRGAGAFLATEMNGSPLGLDHGFPVRLVVPGWYGCTAIKWVNEIAFLDADAPATGQMREYAARTHQRLGPGEAPLAREFSPATVDPAATAIRVEKRRAGVNTVYRILGIAWGVPPGPPPADALHIRVGQSSSFVPVERLAEAAGPLVPWSHTFRPSAAGRHSIALRWTVPGVRTRRLDLGYYTREIEVV